MSRPVDAPNAPNEPPSITAVVLDGGSADLAECVQSLLGQAPPLHEVIVVSRRAGAAPESVQVRPGSRNRAAARNAGARAATGAVVAFVDAGARARPGWAAGLGARFAAGATLVAGGPLALHDLRGRRDFLPSASVRNLAIRREVLEDLGGFDPDVAGAEDRDLSYRAQLAGHALAAAPEAAVALPSGRSPALACRVRLARAGAAMRWKYRYFVFHGDPPPRRGVLVARVAERVASGLGSLELLCGWRPAPDQLKPSSGAQELTARELDLAPALLLVAPGPVSASLLARLASLVPDLAVAPPGLVEEAVGRWDERAPWSLAQARRAAAHGWDVPVELAARRLERERPASVGEACLGMHAVHAWLRGCTRFAVVASGRAAEELARRLPGAPVLVVGRGELARSLPAPGRLIARLEKALAA